MIAAVLVLLLVRVEVIVDVDAVEVVALHHVEEDGKGMILYVRVRRVHPVMFAVGLREVRPALGDVIVGRGGLRGWRAGRDTG